MRCDDYVIFIFVFEMLNLWIMDWREMHCMFADFL